MTQRRRRVGALSAAMLCLATLSVAADARAASAAPGQSYLTRGQYLFEGQQIATTTQAGARTWLVMQRDGNLVLYTTGTPGTSRRACWASNTVGNGTYAAYQQDGNFVVYKSSNGTRRPTWASGTVNDGGTTVNINRYGQLWAGLKRISGFCT